MNAKDKLVLQDLAKKVAEHAAKPEQEKKKDLWYRHNALEKTRPLVICFPEGCWGELIPPEGLRVEDPLGRAWEMGLRQRLYHDEVLKDDRVETGFFNVSYRVDWGDYGVTTEYIGAQTKGGAYVWIPPIKQDKDFEKLRFREPKADWEGHSRDLALAHELFDGILKVRVRGAQFWNAGLTAELIRLRGLEQIMEDMTENPGILHKIMGFLRDAASRELDFLEKENLQGLNNEDDYNGSGGYGFTRELPGPGYGGVPRLKDWWGFAESQEFTCVSPVMLEEFALNYQLPLLERFGLNSYGCCEVMDRKYELVKKVPRLRRVSVSPFCDTQIAARALGDKYIYSWKPHPADLAAPNFDEARLRAGIRRQLEIARDCVLEIVMKDTHTVANQPQRYQRWVRLAMEEAGAA
jgi:hypothetical protein